MRRVLLALLLLAMPAQAAINDPLPFEAEFPFTRDLEHDNVTVVSGAFQAELRNVRGAFGFFDTPGAAVEGLNRVCWTAQAGNGCGQGDMEIRVMPGGSFGVDFPGAADAVYEAEHALSIFIDFRDNEDLNSFRLGRTVTAPSVDGLVTFGNIDRIERFFGFPVEGGLTGLDDDTRVQVYRDGALIETFVGKTAILRFEGAPHIDPFRSDFVVLPFEDGSVARFGAPPAAAAAEGLDFGRITRIFEDLQAANEQNSDGPAGEGQTIDLGDLQKVLEEVMNSALLRFPAGETPFEETFAFVQFESLLVRGVGDGLRWSGRAALQIQGGDVAGAPDLVGIGYFAIPWWSIMLWVIAIGVFTARLVVKPPKQHPTWDRYKWAGWVFGALAGILLFILWDLEIRAVWGTSLLSTDARGEGLLLTAAVQMLPLLFALFAVAAPLRIIFRNGLILGRQGTFMGLSGGVAYLLAYGIGATLILAYIELVVVQVMENLSG